MDKAGIGVTIAVVTIALTFIAFSGSVSNDINPIVEKTTTTIKETGQKIQESGSETLEKVKETTQNMATKTKDLEEVAKELASSKLPSRLVSIPAGTSIPGCEDADLCYDPASLIIFVGGEIIWKNNDNSAHTITSGNIIEGPDEIFDSGLIKAGETFSFKFEKTGNYSYFCMIHPWATGSVIVS